VLLLLPLWRNSTMGLVVVLDIHLDCCFAGTAAVARCATASNHGLLVSLLQLLQ
jgi:hypothetical protein